MFKYIFIILIIFSSCLTGPNNNVLNNDDHKLQEPEEAPFFSMRRTPCFGKCPTYEVIFYKDGKVLYEGNKFVKNEGFYAGQINIKTIALIQDKIREIDFFELDSIYDAKISDLPSVILEVNIDDKKHKVIDRYKGPIKLRDFEKFIDNIVLQMESGLIGNWEKISE